MRNLRQQVEQPQDHRSTFIYALVDPRNNTIRYIGKSVKPRARFTGHLSQSSLKKSSHKNNWIKSLLAIGLKPELEIIDEVDYRDDWTIEEKRWIARIRNLAPNYPPLTNVADGGEGATGWIASEEYRRKTSARMTGIKMPPGTGDKIRAWHLGRKKTAEHRIHCSDGQRNRWSNASEEEKQKMLKNLRNPLSIEQRENISRRARNYSRPINASSPYRNVVKVANRGKSCWKAGCIIKGKQICIGYFTAEEEAARARDRYVLKHIGEHVILNFPRSEYPLDPRDINTERVKRSHSQKFRKNPDGYMGVSKNGKKGWRADISHMGVRYHLGTHRTPEEAARRYDLKAIELLGDRALTNFPHADYA
jgi:hypothetical protein